MLPGQSVYLSGFRSTFSKAFVKSKVSQSTAAVMRRNKCFTNQVFLTGLFEPNPHTGVSLSKQQPMKGISTLVFAGFMSLANTQTPLISHKSHSGASAAYFIDPLSNFGRMIEHPYPIQPVKTLPDTKNFTPLNDSTILLEVINLERKVIETDTLPNKNQYSPVLFKFRYEDSIRKQELEEKHKRELEKEEQLQKQELELQQQLNEPAPAKKKKKAKRQNSATSKSPKRPKTSCAPSAARSSGGGAGR